MLDFTSRETLPKNEFGRVHLDADAILASANPANMGPLLNSGLAFAGDEENDYNIVCAWLRSNVLALAQDMVAKLTDGHNHWGDDCGDYANATADALAMFQTTFDMAMWHSELTAAHIDQLNLWLNCADENHDVHWWALDGPDLPLDRVAVDWESCPNHEANGHPIGP